MKTPMRSFTDPPGFVKSPSRRVAALDPGHAIQTDQWRAANRFQNIVAAHEMVSRLVESRAHSHPQSAVHNFTCSLASCSRSNGAFAPEDQMDGKYHIKRALHGSDCRRDSRARNHFMRCNNILEAIGRTPLVRLNRMNQDLKPQL